jgi:menaquinone-dependent protoporphyrinogen oxidase
MVATPRALVAYATAAGSTAGIAERIADVMRTAGCDVVCRPADAGLDPTGFDGFVLGSAVHNRTWLPGTIALLRRVAASGDRPVWCFSVGAVNPRGRYTRFVARGEVQNIERQFPAGFTAWEHRVFGGVVETRGLPLWGRLGYRLTGARPGDHRDWPAVESWARSVASALITATAPRGTAASSYRPPEPPAGW